MKVRKEETYLQKLKNKEKLTNDFSCCTYRHIPRLGQTSQQPREVSKLVFTRLVLQNATLGAP